MTFVIIFGKIQKDKFSQTCVKKSLKTGVILKGKMNIVKPVLRGHQWEKNKIGVLKQMSS